MIQTPKNIAIIGSGLVGSLLAIYLRKMGHSVTVFDRRPDIRTIEFSGRSINLAMSNRGWKALRKVGLEEQVKEIAIPLDKRAMHVNEKPLYFQKYGKDGEAIWSISRGVLNKKMIDLAEQEGTVFRFNEKVWMLTFRKPRYLQENRKRVSGKSINLILIFGCDGAFSRVRHKMQRRSRFDYSQDFIDVGTRNSPYLPMMMEPTNWIKIPPYLAQRQFMLIAMPNLDGSFTCTLFLPFEGDISFEKITTKKRPKSFLRLIFPM